MTQANSATDRKELIRQALVKIEDLQARLRRAEEFRRAPIAIVGMGCRFPGGANGPDRFWHNLAHGVDSITEIPPDRWNADTYYDPDPDAPGKTYSRHGGFLADVDRFDPLFFGIAPRDAMHMDPQYRILLEVAWEALEHAGQPINRLHGSKTGVFIGIATQDYSQILLERGLQTLEPYHLTGMPANFAPGRLAYVLGLQGPCMALDTACSSSLVAVHLACQSLRQGECDMALAGGVSLLLTPQAHIVMSRARILSPTGRCRTFDAAADGIVRADGCGVIVLKRLQDALAARDPVLAIIRGSAVNQDGASGGITVPNKRAQETVIRDALENAGLSPEAVSYVEAHGTGTPLGDPIEISALSNALCQQRPSGAPLRVGSVKTNIGHTEAAAGVAGLIKVVLALQNGLIPPHLHLQSLNPHLSWKDLGIHIPTSAMPWTGPERFAGISSFGASGTNAHVIVEAAPKAASAGEPDAAGTAVCISLSARAPDALRELASAYAAEFGRVGAPSMRDIAYTTTLRRSHHDYRAAVVARSHAELVARLEALGRGEAAAGVAEGRRKSNTRPRVVFVFPGQGSQWLGMGRQLLQQEPVFRDAIAACDAAIRPYTDFSILAELEADEASSRLDRIDVIQPILFAFEVALAALWRSFGITPDAVIGHSMGEVAAAHVAGAISLDHAARIICRRSALLRRVSGKGVMAMVELDLAGAAACLRGYEDRVSIAVSNSPRSTVLAGDPAAMDQILAHIESQGIFCRRIKVDVASHSPQVDPLRDDLLSALDGVVPRAGQIPIYSTVDVAAISGAGMDAAYWVRNLREPVQFARMVDSLLHADHRCFVEMSPHPILVPAIEQMLVGADSDAVALPSLRRGEDERTTLLESLGALYVRGVVVDFSALSGQGTCVALPGYAWQRERYWPEPVRAARPTGTGHPLLGVPLHVASQPHLHIRELDIGTSLLPYLADHRVYDGVVLPGSVYVEMALAMGRTLWQSHVEIEELAFQDMLVLPEQEIKTLQAVLIESDDSTASITVSHLTGVMGTEPGWVHLASARLRRRQTPATLPAAVSLNAVRSRCHQAIPGSDYYAALASKGLRFGPAFQGVQEVWRGSGEALGRVRLSDSIAARSSAYELHPTLLDAGLQVLAAALPDFETTDPGFSVTTGIRALRMYEQPGTEVWSHARVSVNGDRRKGFVGDVSLYDADGRVLVEILGLRVERVEAQPVNDSDLVTLAWTAVAAQQAPAAAAPGRWLVLAEEASSAEALAICLRAHGQDVTCLDARICDEESGYVPQALAQFLYASGSAGPVGVVYHAGAVPSEHAPGGLATAARAMYQRALCLVRALSGLDAPPRLWLLTCGVQRIDHTTGPVALAQSVLWGLGRTAMVEHPALRCTRIDLDPAHPAEEAKLLACELLADADEDELALRGNHRYAARIAPADLRKLKRRSGAPSAKASSLLREDATYLVAGHLSGLGMRLALWLVQSGARRIALLGSPVPAPELAELERLEATVEVLEADLSDLAGARAYIERITAGAPLAGVLYVAGMQPEPVPLHLQITLSPSANAEMVAAHTLHQATAGAELDFFVFHGTAALLIGGPGLGSAASLGTFLDALAQHRRELGLPARVLAWPNLVHPHDDKSAAAGHTPPQAAPHLGLRILTTDQAGAIWQRLEARAQQAALLGVIPFDGSAQSDELARFAQLPRFASWLSEALRAAQTASSAVNLRDTLQQTEPSRRGPLIEQFLRDTLAQTMRVSPARIERDTPVRELGIDSLMLLQVRNQIERALGVSLPATALWMHPDIASLGAYLQGELSNHTPETSTSVQPFQH